MRCDLRRARRGFWPKMMRPAVVRLAGAPAARSFSTHGLPGAGVLAGIKVVELCVCLARAACMSEPRCA